MSFYCSLPMFCIYISPLACPARLYPVFVRLKALLGPSGVLQADRSAKCTFPQQLFVYLNSSSVTACGAISLFTNLGKIK